MKNVHTTLFLIVLLYATCEGKYLPDPEEPVQTPVEVFEGLLGDNSTSNVCVCSSKDCKCCYEFGTLAACTLTKIVLLDEENDELALEGTVTVNNNNFFTTVFKLKDMPNMCGHFQDFDTCVSLKYEYLDAKTKVRICGHITSSYGTTAFLNLDLFCKTLEVKKKLFNVESTFDINENGSFSLGDSREE